MSTKRIIQSTSVISLTTGISRVLGFVRDLLLAQLFGTSVQAQAFVVAFRLPNLFRELVAEGAVTSAFVPVLSWYRAQGDPAEFWKVSQALLTRLGMVLVVIGVLGSWAAVPIVRVVAPGFAQDPEAFNLTVALTRVLFPFVILVGLWAYFMGLLNTLHRFFIPALGPAVLNIAMIIACVGFVHRVEPGIWAVVIAVLIGGLVQLVLQIAAAWRIGFRWRPVWSHPATHETLKLLGPRILGSAAYQINVLVHTALASLGSIVGFGAVAALYYANRLVNLPLALFASASAQASLPTLATQAAQHDRSAFQRTLLGVLRMVLFLTLPSAVGLFVLGDPIVRGLFERGAFDQDASALTVTALRFYALGLWAYALGKVFSGAFYALKDTRTPMRLSIEAVVINLVLSLVLMWPLKIGGLALAASIANTVNALRLLVAMQRRMEIGLVRSLGAAFMRMLAASMIMGFAAAGLWRYAMHHLALPLAIPGIIILSVAIYALASKLLRVEEINRVHRWLSARNT